MLFPKQLGFGIMAADFYSLKTCTKFMPRKLFKRLTPDPQKIRKEKSLKFLGALLHDPNLFHLNRHSVSVAFFVGLSVAFLPFPGQMIIAAFGALLFRCNLPIAVSLVWVTNPFTFLFIFIGTYKFGAWIMDLPHRNFTIELSWSWLQTEFLIIWQPLLLGSVLASLFFGCLGYLVIQWMWRWNIVRKLQKRRLRAHNTRSNPVQPKTPSA